MPVVRQQAAVRDGSHNQRNDLSIAIGQAPDRSLSSVCSPAQLGSPRLSDDDGSFETSVRLIFNRLFVLLQQLLSLLGQILRLLDTLAQRFLCLLDLFELFV